LVHRGVRCPVSQMDLNRISIGFQAVGIRKVES
jgi:hypothetical protein